MFGTLQCQALHETSLLHFCVMPLLSLTPLPFTPSMQGFYPGYYLYFLSLAWLVDCHRSPPSRIAPLALGGGGGGGRKGGLARLLPSYCRPQLLLFRSPPHLPSPSPSPVQLSGNRSESICSMLRRPLPPRPWLPLPPGRSSLRQAKTREPVCSEAHCRKRGES